MPAILGDITQFAQAIMCRALENAKSEDAATRDLAHHWLTCDENYLRELILEATLPNVHQDWIDDYVKNIQEERDDNEA